MNFCRVSIIVILLMISAMGGYPTMQAFANSKPIGTQSDDALTDDVNDLIRCLGNVLLPPTVCVGTNHKDKITASGVGMETIYGLDGDDLIQADIGSDVVFGGEGDDIISGGEGSDSIFGEDGDDVLIGDSGTNVVFGGGGNFLYGGEGDDRLLGGSDNDVLTGGPGKDFFDCNEGADTVADFNPNEDTANNNCEVLKSI
ncbi:MAG TPA: calcium-binding protein [Nitrososphaeraceae archaeon]